MKIKLGQKEILSQQIFARKNADWHELLLRDKKISINWKVQLSVQKSQQPHGVPSLYVEVIL